MFRRIVAVKAIRFRAVRCKDTVCLLRMQLLQKGVILRSVEFLQML
ncbi:hypothetical protein VT99_11062 [Candidatus Electrothrix marina]|nr:hypothetical protein VT99_11062 [Candidatus Electrothrix marina]